MITDAELLTETQSREEQKQNLSAIDFDAVRAAIDQAVPFNRHVGVELLEVTPVQAVARLPEGEHLKNHVGTQHAGALWLAGELAGGAAFVGTFADHMGDIRFVAKQATISYLRPAGGPVTATATLDRQVAEVLAAIEHEGRAQVEVPITLTDENDARIAEMTVLYSVKRLNPNPNT